MGIQFFCQFTPYPIPQMGNPGVRFPRRGVSTPSSWCQSTRTTFWITSLSFGGVYTTVMNQRQGTNKIFKPTIFRPNSCYPFNFHTSLHHQKMKKNVMVALHWHHLNFKPHCLPRVYSTHYIFLLKHIYIYIPVPECLIRIECVRCHGNKILLHY